MTERSARFRLRSALEEWGYSLDHEVAVATEGQLYVFAKRDALDVEVHFDELNFCHRIPLYGRLGGNSKTLAFTDLLFSKLQMEEPTPADACDLIALLGQIANNGELKEERVDEQRIAELAGEDWGLWYTATQNLRRVDGWIRQFGTGLDDATANSVRHEAAAGLTMVLNVPKSMRWRIRSLIGTRMQWYQDVSDDRRTF